LSIWKLEGTPHVTCTVRLDGERGVRLIIPYIQGAEEYKSVENWFE